MPIHQVKNLHSRQYTTPCPHCARPDSCGCAAVPGECAALGEAAVVAAIVVEAGDEVPLEAAAPGEAAVVKALVVVAGDEVPLKAAAPGALPANAHAWLPSS